MKFHILCPYFFVGDDNWAHDRWVEQKANYGAPHEVLELADNHLVSDLEAAAAYFGARRQRAFKQIYLSNRIKGGTGILVTHIKGSSRRIAIATLCANFRVNLIEKNV